MTNAVVCRMYLLSIWFETIPNFRLQNSATGLWVWVKCAKHAIDICRHLLYVFVSGQSLLLIHYFLFYIVLQKQCICKEVMHHTIIFSHAFPANKCYAMPRTRLCNTNNHRAINCRSFIQSSLKWIGHC